MQEQDTRNSEDRPSRPKIRLTKPMIVVWVVVGAVLLYFSSWIGPLAFYYRFQKPLQEGTFGVPNGIIWSWPRAVALTSRASAWEYRRHGEHLLPVPPTHFTGFRNEDLFVVAVCQAGEIRYRCYPPNYIRGLFRTELEKIGGEAGDLPDDPALLAEIVRVNPNDYSFQWSAQERSLYTARILTKMCLFDDRTVRRMELARRVEPPGLSVLVEYGVSVAEENPRRNRAKSPQARSGDAGDSAERIVEEPGRGMGALQPVAARRLFRNRYYEDGATKILTATSEGTLIIILAPDAPDAWKASPAPWLPPES